MYLDEERDEILTQIKDFLNIIKDMSGKKRVKSSSASVGLSKQLCIEIFNLYIIVCSI